MFKVFVVEFDCFMSSLKKTKKQKNKLTCLKYYFSLPPCLKSIFLPIKKTHLL